MRIHKLILTLAALGMLANTASAVDWIFDQSKFTNDPTTGKRVEQYKKKKTPTLVPYDKYFSHDGPGAYIPYSYYQEELGISEGLYGGFGSIGGEGYGGIVPGGYGGPIGF